MGARELSALERVRVEAFGLDRPECFEWPEGVVDATADALIAFNAAQSGIVHEIGLAYMRFAGAVERGSAESIRRNSLFGWWVSAFIANATTAVLLTEVQKHDPALADQLAGLVWELTEDGGALGELSWEYLHKRGHDADAVFRIARDAAREVLAVIESDVVDHVGWKGSDGD